MMGLSATKSNDEHRNSVRVSGSFRSRDGQTEIGYTIDMEKGIIDIHQVKPSNSFCPEWSNSRLVGSGGIKKVLDLADGGKFSIRTHTPQMAKLLKDHAETLGLKTSINLEWLRK